MTTQDNLAEAFAGESQANRKYLAYAEAAAADGFPQVARLFRAVAQAETIHALAHFRALGAVKATAENLKDALAGEKHEFESMYPGFVATAGAEGATRALVSLKNAMAVEKVHFDLFEQALAAVESGEDLADATVSVCAVCGHTVVGAPPDNCPVCGARAVRYSGVE